MKVQFAAAHNRLWVAKFCDHFTNFHNSRKAVFAADSLRYHRASNPMISPTVSLWVSANHEFVQWGIWAALAALPRRRLRRPTAPCAISANRTPAPSAPGYARGSCGAQRAPRLRPHKCQTRRAPKCAPNTIHIIQQASSSSAKFFLWRRRRF